METSANQRRAYWLKTLHQWHWISSALCLLGMLLFAATGFTLNHAGQIEAHPVVTSKKATLPADLQAQLATLNASDEDDKANDPLPPALQQWTETALSVDVGAREAEWSPEEVYVAMPRPGGDAWLRIDRSNGEVEYELTDRGWISYLNDLHKGRNTGTAWSWFIDLFALSCLIFSITGLFILKMHATNRPTTWPIVGLGVLIPLLLAILFIH
ncbi:PepSY-associated TM helix domain-containing protein [Oxalicibacterium solurbis]|uniref:Membrane protein n=1 Tax=Oxalicibacterium solurbis TaxID=69280 RepID=A0A8J3B0Y4_9BURK|nr:PepSY-associated TM helix domain-containing protein [Oxalicibacterium solurbis]GGI55071.1 membrane protein [Oxalicibacterium solurbis]